LLLTFVSVELWVCLYACCICKLLCDCTWHCRPSLCGQVSWNSTCTQTSACTAWPQPASHAVLASFVACTLLQAEVERHWSRLVEVWGVWVSTWYISDLSNTRRVLLSTDRSLSLSSMCACLPPPRQHSRRGVMHTKRPDTAFEPPDVWELATPEKGTWWMWWQDIRCCSCWTRDPRALAE